MKTVRFFSLYLFEPWIQASISFAPLCNVSWSWSAAEWLESQTSVLPKQQLKALTFLTHLANCRHRLWRKWQAACLKEDISTPISFRKLRHIISQPFFYETEKDVAIVALHQWEAWRSWLGNWPALWESAVAFQVLFFIYKTLYFQSFSRGFQMFYPGKGLYEQAISSNVSGWKPTVAQLNTPQHSIWKSIYFLHGRVSWDPMQI